ncbi:hypothetical protein GX51_01937 [Blastomyces parvus]|uniref:SH3 domain-containing protein n=1 Tax=Blastomyces parvus TaxID=2060905 RepID=A0A2B7XE11_9EURO|nr:hypothetical protein GX51_01937 [Blastomyces parvus]
MMHCANHIRRSSSPLSHPYLSMECASVLEMQDVSHEDGWWLGIRSGWTSQVPERRDDSRQFFSESASANDSVQPHAVNSSHSRVRRFLMVLILSLLELQRSEKG